MNNKLYFTSDYMEGAHPNIINRLVETNLCHTQGYGLDEFCESAKSRIREACECPDAEIYFLVGGTQTNATIIDGLLSSYQGVIAADSGHVAVHESGAIEFGGHKVLTLPGTEGKISAEQIDKYVNGFYADGNWEHMVNPGMVYISQPTEFGTLYSLEELTAISNVCRSHNIPLFVDGARLAYALGSKDNDVTLPDLARLADVFYIGGTKCGALFGEAVVIPNKGLIPHFFTIIKQHGALLAKGRILGIQFDELFKDNLYLEIGKNAVEYASELQEALRANGYEIYMESPTNQIFTAVDNHLLERIAERVEYGFWENVDDSHTAIRFATSWATTRENIDELISFLKELK